mgnify:CR=1 FL=1
MLKKDEYNQPTAPLRTEVNKNNTATSNTVNLILGNAERCVSLMVDRAKTRVAFGKPLIEQGSIQQDIALSRYRIDGYCPVQV